MTVIEKINEINDVIKEVFEFTQSNQTVSDDFNEYLATIGAREISLSQMEKIFLPYIGLKVTTATSLIVTFGILALGIALSLYQTRKSNLATLEK